MSNFELFSLVRASAKRVLIDSCLQHAAAAYKLPSTVLWIGTHPEMFGYSMHTNMYVCSHLLCIIYNQIYTNIPSSI